MTLLSICIPTYNREHIISENVSYLLDGDFLDDGDVDLVLSDNCSADKSYSVIQDLVCNSRYSKKIKINKNSANIGVFANIFKLFELSSSKYVLISSDEEFLIKENFPVVKSFLQKVSPTFVSPQIFVDGELYRGSRKTEKLPISSWKTASRFTSGLIFDREKTLNIILAYRELLLADHIYYAQSLLVAELLISHPNTQWFLNVPTVYKRFFAPTSVSSERQYKYWSVSGRWEAFKALDTYFSVRASSASCDDVYRLINVFSRDNKRSLYKSLSHAINAESEHWCKDFRTGAIYAEFKWASPLLIKSRAATLNLINFIKRGFTFLVGLWL